MNKNPFFFEKKSRLHKNLCVAGSKVSREDVAKCLSNSSSRIAAEHKILWSDSRENIFIFV